MNENAGTDIELRRKILDRLYRAYREEGLYRGVVSRKVLARELELSGVELERNLEYLLERGLIRMHKIEDLVSITPDGIDRAESRPDQGNERIADSLEKIGSLLEKLLHRLPD